MTLAITSFLSQHANIFIGVLLVVNFIVSLLLIIVVLMQRSKNEGLGATFGGGTMDSAFGADTTNVLKRFTIWLMVAFFALTLALGWFFAHRSAPGIPQSALEKAASQAVAKPEENTLDQTPAAGESSTPSTVEEGSVAPAATGNDKAQP